MAKYFYSCGQDEVITAIGDGLWKPQLYINSSMLQYTL